MHIEVDSDGYQSPRAGGIFLFSLVAFLFLLFVFRFWYLQILNGEDFAQQAQANRTREEQVYATRGLLQDMHGRLLADNRPALCLALVPDDCPDIPATLAQVAQWADLPLSVLASRLQLDTRKIKPFEPQVLVSDIPFEQMVLIEKQLFQWPGLSIVARQRRFYPEGELFAHVLGYVAEANEAEMEADPDLRLGDVIGKSGLELVMENPLRGANGLNRVEIDVLGRQLSKTQKYPPKAGDNYMLSLDIDLQKAATAALEDHSGCIVVMEPETGKVRALVTRPSYDNNLFTTRLSPEDWGMLRDNPEHPLYNRVIQSVYPPGSVWKLMMAGLFLSEGINPKETVYCGGSFKMGNRSFRCWRAGGHGTVDMKRSLVESCDVYYYSMADRVGIDKIERFAKSCGFGSKTGIDLPHERTGLVPGKAWKLAAVKEPWQKGDTLNVSIGQGATLVTPVQIAVYVSALLNGGKLHKPLLLENEPPEVTGLLPLDQKQMDFILDGMHETAASGTARVINRPDATMGGKTGTAQAVRIGDVRLRAAQMAYLHRDHAWIATWGKKDDKTYVVVVMVEHGGGGSSTAGPVCAKVYSALFDEKAPEPGSSEKPSAENVSAPQGQAAGRSD